MIIYTISHNPSEAHEISRIYLTTLEHDPTFEAAIWQARGWLGIKNDGLHGNPQPNDSNLKVYDTALREHPDWHQPQGEFDADIPEASSEIIIAEQEKYDRHLRNITANLISAYKVPLSWATSMGIFIETNRFPLVFDFQEPAIAHIQTDSLPRLAKHFVIAEQDAKATLSAHNQKPDGVKITISARMKKSAFKKWADDHWPEIEQLMDAHNLPDHWIPQMTKFDLYLEVHHLQQAGLTNAEIAAKLSARDGYEALGYEDIHHLASMYRKYFEKSYQKEIRKKSTD